MPSPEGGAATLEPGAAEWQASVEQAETEAPPTEPLIDAAAAEAVSAEIKEREAAEPLKAFAYAREQAEKELAERYKLTDKSALKRFSGRIKAYFAGEFQDLKLSEKLAVLSPDEQIAEVKRLFNTVDIAGHKGALGLPILTRILGVDIANRLNKVAAKTALSGGVGVGIAVALGGSFVGTLASPVFLSALAGGAIFRTAYEVYRHIDPREKNARTEIIMARANVLSEALEYQEKAGELAKELSDEATPATPERKQEIQGELDKLKEYLIKLTSYESSQSVNPTDKTPDGLEKVRQLSEGKMAFERKREKTADLIAAGGSLLGGIVGNVVQQNLAHGALDKLPKGLMAKFSPETPGLDKAGHFIDKINTADIKVAAPGFVEQLQKNGYYAFHYNSGSEYAGAVDYAMKHSAQLTTAQLNDESYIHIIKGMNDAGFRQLLLERYPDVAAQVSHAATAFAKEALPIIGAQVLGLVSNFGGRRTAEVRSLGQAAGSNVDVEQEFLQGFNAPTENKPPIPEKETTKFKVGEPFYFGHEHFVIGNVDTSGPEPVYTLVGQSPDGEKYSMKKTESRLGETAERSQERLNRYPTSIKQDPKPEKINWIERMTQMNNEINKRRGEPSETPHQVTSQLAEAALHGWDDLQARFTQLSSDERVATNLRFTWPPKNNTANHKIYTVRNLATKESLFMSERDGDRPDIETKYEVYTVDQKNRTRPVKTEAELISILQKFQALLPAAEQPKIDAKEERKAETTPPVAEEVAKEAVEPDEANGPAVETVAPPQTEPNQLYRGDEHDALAEELDKSRPRVDKPKPEEKEMESLRPKKVKVEGDELEDINEPTIPRYNEEAPVPVINIKSASDAGVSPSLTHKLSGKNLDILAQLKEQIKK